MADIGYALRDAATGAVPVNQGGLGVATITGYLKGNGTNAVSAVSSIPGADVSGDISGNAANVTGTVLVTHGGTGATTLTGYMKGNGTGTVTASSTIPGTDISGNISGNAANVTGVVAIANGGSGQTTQQAAINALTGSQSSGKYLRSDGTNSTLTTIQAGDVPTLNQNTSGTASNVTGVVAIANGGTNSTSASAARTALGIVNAPTTGQLFLSGAGGWNSITNGCTGPNKSELASNKVNIQTLDFAQSVQSFAEWFMVMPTNWDGLTITAKFVWTTTSTSTNSVVWGLAARAYGDSITLDQALGTAIEVTQANTSTASQNHISSATSAITIAGSPAAGQLVRFRAYRLGSGSDNLAATAQLLGIQVTYGIA